ncbi:MAG: 23S rRNA (adenine(2503)-C(2))-methyltransferase RlmN [Deltaproteobacteria bacterium]|nr:23S rRNA (adenine(2503)-C(2))-methyltransferase RlmN [Deltaproteobacteria bacterium]
MLDILNLTFPELEDFMHNTLGEPRFRAAQVRQWLWRKMACDFEEMTNVSKDARRRLAESAVIRLPQVRRIEKRADGTEKFLLALHDGALVETVLIPSVSRNGATRYAQCLSCQVGCVMGCSFCATGEQGFERNMTMSEILGQVLIVRKHLDDLKPEQPKLRNLVFMGMGEPLLNLREVLRSLETLNDKRGLCFSPRRISVSTCGVDKGLRELGDSGLAFLAVSLHAPNQELRAQIMPKAATWPLEDLLCALEEYPLKTRERITFEYLLLGGVNDGPEHARELVRLLSHIKAKLNLILCNPTPDGRFTAPSPERVLAFEKILWEKGITAVVRKSKGQDINAACGQLKSRHMK